MAALFVFPPVVLDKTGLATSTLQTAQLTELQNINTELDTQTGTLTNIDANIATIQTTLDDSLTALNVIESDLVAIAGYVDQIEGNQAAQTTSLNTIATNTANTITQVSYLSPKLDVISSKTVLTVRQISALLDASVTPIPVAGALTVIASTVDNMYKFQTVDDIGEYMTLCTGAPGSEAAIAALPLGGGEVFVYVPSGTRLSLKSLTGSNITSGKIVVNAMGLGQP
jgi:hypothetical protein